MVTLSIIIPAYNEAATIRLLLDQVLEFKHEGIDKEVILVESGSTDGTRQIVEEYANQGLVRAFHEPKPQGKGHALRTGLKQATGEIILIQDADLEYRISDYPALLEPLLKGEAQFVLGSRHLGMSDWKIRKFVTGKFYAWLINCGHMVYTGTFNLLYGTRLTDPATMFKVFKRDCLPTANLKSNYFELDWEIVAKLVKAGHIPIEVPVSYTSRTMEEGKKIRIWRDGLLVLWAILKFRWFN